MTFYVLVTESGSQYSIDTNVKTLRRERGREAARLDYDNDEITYEKLLSELTVDTPLRVLWKDGERWRVRSTTNIVKIERS